MCPSAGNGAGGRNTKGRTRTRLLGLQSSSRAKPFASPRETRRLHMSYLYCEITTPQEKKSGLKSQFWQIKTSSVRHHSRRPRRFVSPASILKGKSEYSTSSTILNEYGRQRALCFAREDLLEHGHRAALAARFSLSYSSSREHLFILEARRSIDNRE